MEATRSEVARRMTSAPSHQHSNATGEVSQKYKNPSIFKYGCVELHFEQSTDGALMLVFMEDDDGVGITLLD